MTTTQLAAWVMLAFCGLYSGAILIYAVDRVHVLIDGHPSPHVDPVHRIE